MQVEDRFMDLLPIADSDGSPGPSTSGGTYYPNSNPTVCKECFIPTPPTQFDTYGSVMVTPSSAQQHTLGNHIGLKDPITG